MNILLGSHGFPPQQAAGAEWRTYRTARWLAEQGHAVQVLAINQVGGLTQAEVALTQERVEGFVVHRLSYNLNQAVGERAEFDNPIAAQVLTALLAQTQFDVFHLICGFRITGSVLAAAQAMNVPTVVSLTDFWFLCPRLTLLRSTGDLCLVPDDPIECAHCMLADRRRYRLPYQATRGVSAKLLINWWQSTHYAGFADAQKLNQALQTRRQYLRQVLANAQKIIAPSQFLADIFEKQGVPRQQIVVLRQGVQPVLAVPRQGRSSGPGVVFGYIGQLASHKGSALLIKAFRALPHAKSQISLRIYGDPQKTWPPFWKEMEQSIAADERIILAGSFVNSEAGKIYNQLDVVVMPSIWYENSPNVILEAFACQVPVIAADIGGMAELVQHEQNGLLFEAGVVESLTQALQRCIAEPDLIGKLQKGIPKVKSLQEEMDALTDIYLNVLSKVGPGALTLAVEMR